MKINLMLGSLIFVMVCHLSYQESEADFQTSSNIYEVCSQSARCFGMPDGCLKDKSCVVLLTATPQSCQCGGADFQLYWNRDNSSQDNWVGAALSSDKKMGNDSVTECILWQNKTVTARQGLTFGGDDYGVNTVEPIQGITNETGDYNDGVVHCSWRRIADTNVTNFDFNILNDKYYIFLAYGPLLAGELDHHSHTWISNEAVYLGDPMPNVTTTVPPSTTTSNMTTQTSVTHTESTGPSTAHTGTNQTTEMTSEKPTTSMPETTTKGSSLSIKPSIVCIVFILLSIALRC